MSGVRVRRGHLAVGVVVLGGALAFGGAAQSQSPSAGIMATDPNAFKTLDGGAPAVTVAAGARSASRRAASTRTTSCSRARSRRASRRRARQAARCRRSPTRQANAPWSGTCTFTAPAVYTFYCAFHGEDMNGSVTVPRRHATAARPAAPASGLAAAASSTTVPRTRRLPVARHDSPAQLHAARLGQRQPREHAAARACLRPPRRADRRAQHGAGSGRHASCAARSGPAASPSASR